MLRIIAYVVGIAVLAVLGIVGYAATKPDSFRIERSIAINAAPEKVFAIVQDFHRSSEWSPWEKLDPGMKRELSGAESGVGAVYAWDGNKDVGAGRQEIIEAKPAELVRVKLDFFRPFEASNTVDYAFAADGAGTQMTWAMYGPNPLIARVMQIFFDFDKTVGKDFETGLASLKALAERG
jgi:hypothetical protein